MRGVGTAWLCLGLLMGHPALAKASDSIWAGVVLVTSEPEPQPVPHSLERYEDLLREVFGGNAFYLLGKSKKDIREGSSEWLVPCAKIYMEVTVLDSDMTSYLIRADIYENKDLLVRAEAKVARDAPLLIRGPQWGKGQLVAILEIQ